MEAPRPSLLSGYRPGLRSVVGASATAYGYTLTVGPTSMLLTGAYGPPKPVEVLLFCGGAILAFALVGLWPLGACRDISETIRKRSNCGVASTSFRWGLLWVWLIWSEPSYRARWAGR
jgi:hypothetical protein